MTDEPVSTQVIRLIREVSLDQPRRGWHQADQDTGFHKEIIRLTGGTAPNLVAALEMVGMDLYQAVAVFTTAKHEKDPPKTRKATAR